jgi:hypothetical protein
VTQIAPTLGGAGDAVNARDREQFEEFMTSRWPGLVRLSKACWWLRRRAPPPWTW